MFYVDFWNHTKVKIVFSLSIDDTAKTLDYAPLTDITEPTLEETMKSLCLNDEIK